MHSLTSSAILALCISSAAAWWQPPPKTSSTNTTWQIVLQNPLKPPFPNVTALDGDLFDTTKGNWSLIKKSGFKSICYFSAGSYEEWRADAGQFNETTDLGAPLDGWPGERWLNTNSSNVREIMKRRMDYAVSVGCDAIDPDNLDAYDNNGGGLNLTQADAVNYVKFLSDEGHKRGLAVGLKNAGDIVGKVLSYVDFQVNEQCQQYNECNLFQPFVKANKAVFNIEYVKGTPSQSKINSICKNDAAKGFSTIIKHMALDEWAVFCP